MDAAQVNQLLAERAEQVASYLVPGGKRDGHEWVAGDIHGGEGRSFRVCLAGDKAGFWADFAQSDQRGRGLLSLWTQVRTDGDFVRALREARAFLGLREEEQFRRVRAQPAAMAAAQPGNRGGQAGQELEREIVPLDKAGRVWQYLVKKRQILPETLARYRVGQNRKGDCAVFPVYAPDGVELKMLKFIAIERDEKGKKRVFVLPQGARPSLFGWQAVAGSHGDEIAITEGEIDAMSMCDYGFEALSVPFGAKWPGADGRDPNDAWLEEDFDALSRFACVYLAFDADEPGERAAEAVAPRLGLHRCRKVTPPAGAKDANEALVRGVEPEAMRRAMEEARDFDPVQLRRPSDYWRQLWEAYYPQEGAEPGDEMPWAMPFRVRPGEVTVVQGYTKHGKTVLLSWVLVKLAALFGRGACIASLEIKAVRTLQNMGRQALASRKPVSEEEFAELVRWMDRHLFIYDHVGEVFLDEMLRCFEYAARKYGVQYFVVDSLMRLAVDEEDNTAQKLLMNRLLEFAAQFDVHVFLVAHSKKPDAKRPEETHWPAKYHVRGSAHIVDLAHNVWCVWRNKRKEKDREVAERMPNPVDRAERLAEVAALPDCIFVVQAQRGGDGEEPVKRLWFDQHESWRYCEDPVAGFGKKLTAAPPLLLDEIDAMPEAGV